MKRLVYAYATSPSADRYNGGGGCSYECYEKHGPLDLGYEPDPFEQVEADY